MLDRLADWLFDPAGLTPHGFCLLWQPGLIWTHAISDTAIGLAYFSIPLTLAIVARRRADLVFRPLFWLFAAFILLCGTGHWLDLLTLWVPAYGVQGAVKVVTAGVSLLTAVALWRLLPRALALPSPAQLREANAALHESEARHRAGFQHSPVPLHTLDADGRITGVSDSWLALLGYTKEQVIGHRLRAFQTPDSPSWTPEDQARLVSEGVVLDLDRRLLRRDGAVLDVLLSARQERSGGASWTVCVLMDITARRQAEAALRASEERLRQAQKMEAVGQLSGGIAHDFNNMLQDIAGCLDLMERRVAQGRPEAVLRYVGPARQSVDRAAGLTQRMLAFARRQALQPVPVVPDALARGMEALIRRTVGPAIQVEYRLGEGGARVLCDENQLEAALLNLAINARDAVPDGGTLTISTAEQVLTKDDLSGQDEAAPGDYIEIAVTDTGMGMTPEVLAHAFEPFFTTKPIGQGTGLGLSQLYGFARQSGGLARIESRPGEGTTVRLHLPRHRPDLSAAPCAEDAGPAGPATARGTVLVVEDEPGPRAGIAEVLRDAGMQVLEAEDGPSGLAVVRSRHQLDLLITDVGLPGLNGRQLAEAARESRQGLPVLLITGYSGSSLDGMDLGPGIELLHKPFPLDALVARACAMLEAPLVR